MHAYTYAYIYTQYTYTHLYLSIVICIRLHKYKAIANETVINVYLKTNRHACKQLHTNLSLYD